MRKFFCVVTLVFVNACGSSAAGTIDTPPTSFGDYLRRTSSGTMVAGPVRPEDAAALIGMTYTGEPGNIFGSTLLWRQFSLAPGSYALSAPYNGFLQLTLQQASELRASFALNVRSYCRASGSSTEVREVDNSFRVRILDRIVVQDEAQLVPFGMSRCCLADGSVRDTAGCVGNSTITAIARTEMALQLRAFSENNADARVECSTNGVTVMGEVQVGDETNGAVEISSTAWNLVSILPMQDSCRLWADRRVRRLPIDEVPGGAWVFTGSR